MSPAICGEWVQLPEDKIRRSVPALCVQGMTTCATRTEKQKIPRTIDRPCHRITFEFAGSMTSSSRPFDAAFAIHRPKQPTRATVDPGSIARLL
jgi:hypothetical protein